jgi:prepilin-type N-terminal cleavage/methylation domain-containing protein
MESLLRKYISGFSLFELLITVLIIGVLASIVIPEIQDHTQKAKEAAAKETLQKLRTVIELYTVQHKGHPPGYVKETLSTAEAVIVSQLCSATNLDGEDAPKGTAGFPLEQYLTEIPDNPFNDKNTMKVLADNSSFPAKADDTTGWIYKPLTKAIRLNNDGTDSEGVRYYDY